MKRFNQLVQTAERYIRHFFLWPFSILRSILSFPLILCAKLVKMVFDKVIDGSFYWLVFRLATFFFCGILMTLSASYLYLQPSTKPVDELVEVELETPLRVVTQDGQEIGRFGEKLRTPVAIDQVPQRVIDAVLAAEDDGFYSHGGVDYIALTRSTIELIMNLGRIQSGAGTITMQVARNYLLSREQTFIRKFREILMALQIEETYTKDYILSLYLNGIFFGNRAYGIATAAEVYFGKSLNEVTVPEAALLAALPKAPSKLNPLRNPRDARARRNWVLRRMYSLGWIDEEVYQASLRASLQLVGNGKGIRRAAAYAAEQARLEAINLLGKKIYKGGYTLYTTIESELQNLSVQAVKEGLEQYNKRHGWVEPENRADLMSEGLQRALRQGDFYEFRDYYTYDENGVRIPPSERVEQILDAIELPTFEWAVPVFILATTLSHALAVDRLANLYVIKFTEDLRWARKRYSIDELGPIPTAITDLVRIGDLVYVNPLAEAIPGEITPSNLTQIPAVEGALVVLDSNDGSIRAMVGGYSFNRSQFNRATQARLQVGSTLKPLIYAAALDTFATPATILEDAPIVIQDDLLEGEWRPRNSSRSFFGPIRLREALVHSRNLVTVRTVRQITVEYLVEYLEEKFGLKNNLLAKDLTLSLGNASLTPLELGDAYLTLASGGHDLTPNLLDRIEDSEGRVVWRKIRVSANVDRDIREQLPIQGLDGKPVAGLSSIKAAEQTLDPAIAYQVGDILGEVLVRGTAIRARTLKRPDFVGKTGTTNDAMGTWFVGYNSDHVSIVWVGHDTPQSLGEKEFGSSVALPIWMNLINKAGPLLPIKSLRRPPGLVAARIDPVSGKLVSPTHYGSIFELFRESKLSELERVITEFDTVRVEDIY